MYRHLAPQTSGLLVPIDKEELPQRPSLACRSSSWPMARAPATAQEESTDLWAQPALEDRGTHSVPRQCPVFLGCTPSGVTWLCSATNILPQGICTESMMEMPLTTTTKLCMKNLSARGV
jgi:hypothetical protein